MAENSQNNDKNKGTALNWYIGMLIILLLVMIAGFTINIYIMKKQFINNEPTISKSHQVNNPFKSIQADSTKNYKLKQEDINKLNDHIDYLAEKVEGEVKRTQENNQYDIDRINAFLAIGIGLLAIIGGLLPLFINFFSKESLDKRIDTIQKEANEIHKLSSAAKLVAEDASKKAKTASNTVLGLHGKVQNAEKSIEEVRKALEPLEDGLKEVKEATRKIPYIDLLVFQNAVAKFTSTDALKLFIGASRYNDVASYLQNLILAIDSFDDDLLDKNTDFDVNYFMNVVTELKLALRLGPIRRIPDGRSFQEKIDELVLELSKLEQLELKDLKKQLKIVLAKIRELKILVENKSNP